MSLGSSPPRGGTQDAPDPLCAPDHQLLHWAGTLALASLSSNTDNSNSCYTFIKHLLCARCWGRCFSYFIPLNLHDDEMRQAFFFIQAVQKRKWRHRGINNEQLTQGVRQVYLSPGLNHYILFSLKFWHHLNRQF